jgi:radical SAM superfamily enzyme YgiQ (UPF0313 family)
VRVAPNYGLKGSHPRERQVPLSIAQCAACLRRDGWNVRVVDEMATGEPLSRVFPEIDGCPADLLVISLDSQNFDVIERLVRRLRGGRHRGTFIAAMGQYADTLPERLLAAEGLFNACILDEPELTLCELADAVIKGSSPDGIRGIVYRLGEGGIVRTPQRPLIEDLDTLPFPLYSAFDLDRYLKQSSFVPLLGPVRWGWMLSSRGCPYNCDFCSATLRKSHGGRYRAHSPEYVGRLAAHLADDFGCRALAFEDDIFSQSRTRTLGICDEFMARGLDVKWTAQTHLATLDDEVIHRMQKAGCRGICAGVESGDDELRDRIKGGSLPREKITTNVRLIKESGISLTLYFMVGLPGETLEQMKKTFDFAIELSPDVVQVAYFTPYPGSPAAARLESGRMPDGRMSHYDGLSVNLSGIQNNELETMQRGFYRRYFYNLPMLWRIARHRLPYVLTQHPLEEFRLIARTLKYLGRK